jgi:hypothetical protein
VTATQRAIVWAVVAVCVVGCAFALGRCTAPSRDRALPPPAHPPRAVVPAETAKWEAAIPGWDYDIVAAVVAEADRMGLPPLLLLAVAHQEGGLKRPFPVGDVAIGGSYGPFQIYCPVHPPPTGDCRYWEDPVAAMREMEARWRAVFTDLGGWRAWMWDHVGFLMRFAPRAQGSVAWDEATARTNLGLAEGTYVFFLKGEADRREREATARLVGSLAVAADGLDDLQARAGVLRQQIAALQATLDDLQVRIAIHTDALRDAVNAAR